MASIFDKVRFKVPGSNQFDLSTEHATTFNMGELIPFHVQECLPGDSYKIQSKNLIRFTPMVSPAMTRVKVFTSYFFVPNRIIYDKWEDFITGGQNPATAPTLPFLSGLLEVPTGSLLDYMGIPKGVVLGPNFGSPVSALPLAAYQRIHYDWYRDQNLQNYAWPSLAEGSNSDAFWTTMRKRAWQRDYLTSCLPDAQKGEAVSIPVAGSIQGTGKVVLNDEAQAMIVEGTGSPSDGYLMSDGGNNLSWSATGLTPKQLAELDPNGRYDVDGSDFTVGDISTTINDLRSAWSLQRFFEKMMRGGSRYVDTLKVMFGKAPRDERLQRAEMIGSNIQNVIISEVLQQSETNETPLGEMAGHGISASKDGFFRYTCQEHGFIIGLISVVPVTSYSQGLDRMYSRTSRYDYFWPDFQNLGEQAVYKREVVAKGDPANIPGSKEYNESVFGYQSRYQEYRYKNALVTGDFSANGSLEYWTQARKFDQNLAVPMELNESFIVADPSSRIFAVTDPDQRKLMAHIYSDVTAWRPISKFAQPGW